MKFHPALAARCGLLIVALFLTACAGVGTGSRAADRAEAAFAAGDFAQAAREYLEAAGRSRGAEADAFNLRAAESYRQLADYAAVRQVSNGILHGNLRPGEQLRLDLLLAELAVVEGEHERALNLLTLPADRVPDRPRPRFHDLRARALVELGQPLAAARERGEQMRFAAAEEQASLQEQLRRLLDSVEVRELYRERTGMAAADPLLGATDASLRARGVTPPRMLAGGRDPMAPREPPPTDADGRALYGKVALLVPLTGQIAAAGQAVRDGFMSAYFAGAAPRPEVEVIDSGSTPETALAAYRRALESGAERVVGPLSREAVSALFREPLLPVPLLALNHADGVAPPEGSVQFGLLPDEEALAAADRLLRLGALRAVVVFTEEDWSGRAALAFRSQYEAAGGEVLREVRINARDFDLGRPAASIGDAGADGLFLAIGAQPARLLVPQLRANGVGGTWLAMSRVYGGSPMPALDRDLDGLEFSDAPWVVGTASGVPSRVELAPALRGLQGPALRLFAFGMDAYRLLGYVDWLSGRPYSFINGATGELSVDESRQVRRQLAWARFRGGVPEPVEGALSFGDPL